MSFFLVKAAEEVGEGQLSAAWKTLTSGAPADVQTVEDDAATAFQDFLKVFGPAEATTVLTSLSTAVKSGVKAGVSTLESGTVANAATAGGAAATALAQAATGT